MDKKKVRELVRLIGAFFFLFIYIPCLLFYFFQRETKSIVNSDLERLREQICIKMPLWVELLYFLHNNIYFRSLFYYRIGPIKAFLVSWVRPGERTFMISKEMKMGGGVLIAHTFSTILNAESIGDNLSVRNGTTIGATPKGKPVIGDNVRIGVSVTIIGNVHVGNNVTIGAGSIVVKDIPDNCVVAGNPARIIRYKEVD